MYCFLPSKLVGSYHACLKLAEVIRVGAQYNRLIPSPIPCLATRKLAPSSAINSKSLSSTFLCETLKNWERLGTRIQFEVRIEEYSAC